MWGLLLSKHMIVLVRAVNNEILMFLLLTVWQVKQRKKKLMGFGHRIYKNYDPRASIIKRTAYEVKP